MSVVASQRVGLRGQPNFRLLGNLADDYPHAAPSCICHRAPVCARWALRCGSSAGRRHRASGHLLSEIASKASCHPPRPVISSPTRYTTPSRRAGSAFIVATGDPA
jgi:hypothetical protein